MEQTPEQRPRRRRKLRTAPLPEPSKGRRSRSSHSKSPARASSAPRPRRKGSKEKELRRSSTAGESVDGILKRHGLDAAEILGAADSISVSPPHQKPPEPEPEPRSDGGSEDDLVASLLQMFAAPEGEHRRVITPPPPPRKSLSPWPADMQPPAADGTAADARSQTITELRRRSVDLAAAAVKDREARHKKDEERRRQSITGAQVGVLRQYEPHRNERRKSIAEEHRQIGRRAHAAGQLGGAQPPQPRDLVVHLLLQLQRRRLVDLARRLLRLRLLSLALPPTGLGGGPLRLRREVPRPSVGSVAAEELEAPLLRLGRRVLLLERRGELRHRLHLNRVAFVLSLARRWPLCPPRARPRAERPWQQAEEGPFASAAEGCAHPNRAHVVKCPKRLRAVLAADERRVGE